MLQALLKKNDVKAKWLIGIFSVVVLMVVISLGRYKLHANLNFDVHIFALANAVINATIALLLIAALVAVKNKKYLLHKNIMLTALIFSIIFLVSYIAHHLLGGEALYGDTDHNGFVSSEEAAAVGFSRVIYLIILLTHIFLAAVILPFILFTAYRGLTGEWLLHKKLARIVWPLWLYVAITGPVVYLMISPYYIK